MTEIQSTKKEDIANDPNDNKCDFFLDKIFQSLSGLMGYILTYSVWNFGKLNGVLVCSANSLVASLIFPKHEDIFFSGALGGLSNNVVIPNYGFVVFSGIMVFIVFNLVQNICKGFGGRLGTIAFISNLATTLLIYLISLSDAYSYTYPSLNKKGYENIDIYVYIFAPLFSCVCCVGSYLIYEYVLVVKNKCTATTLTGLTACLLLSIFKTSLKVEDTPGNYGELFMIFVNIGLLGGLAKNEAFAEFTYFEGYNFHHFLIYGYIAGWIGIGLNGILYIGGRHGFTAFLGCNVYIRTLRLIYWLKSICSNSEKSDETYTPNSLKDKQTPAAVIEVQQIQTDENYLVKPEQDKRIEDGNDCKNEVNGRI